MNCQCGGVPVVKHWKSNWKVVCSRRNAGCRIEGHLMRTKRDACAEWDASVKRAGKWTKDDDRKAKELVESLRTPADAA